MNSVVRKEIFGRVVVINVFVTYLLVRVIGNLFVRSILFIVEGFNLNISAIKRLVLITLNAIYLKQIEILDTRYFQNLVLIRHNIFSVNLDLINRNRVFNRIDNVIHRLNFFVVVENLRVVEKGFRFKLVVVDFEKKDINVVNFFI